jgi:serine kinase of HPr protein (carbohydrate metabolism regulator)
MKLKEIVEKLDLKVKSGQDKLDNEIKSGYVSDLLSDVIAHGKEGDIWVTLQVHQNIVTVAVLKNLGGIVIINGRKPEKETLKKAKQENIPILLSNLSAFELVGKLYNLGISGVR